VRHVSSQFDKRVGQVQTVAGIRPDTIYKAKYPASPGTGRILQKLSGIFANSQTVANTQATRLYKWLNRSYTLMVPVDIGLALFGDDGHGLDLADRVLITYDGPAEDADTGAGVYLDLDEASFYVYGINITIDQARRTGTAILTLEQDIA
jgi:hypothetical protein